MKSLLLSFVLLIVSQQIFAQVAISSKSITPDSSAMLEVNDSTRGFLPPRMRVDQRLAIKAPAKGLIVYQTDSTAGLYINTGTPASPAWSQVDTAANKQVAFSATTGQNQYASNSFAQLFFEQELYDYAGAYNPGSGVFTAPAAGVYHFDASIFVYSYASSTRIMLAFFVNGIPNKTGFTSTTADAYYNVAVSADLKLAAGDQVAMRHASLNNSSSMLGSGNSQYCWFNGHRVR